MSFSYTFLLYLIKNVNPSLFIIQLEKVQQQKLNEKKKPGVSSEYRHPEYVTKQTNSHILELLLRRFYCLIFAPP